LNQRRSLRIALVGLSDWDDFIVVDRYPTIGSFAITREALSCPGGTTLNSAVSLARLGVQVSLVSLLGDDHEGQQIREMLDREGIDSRWVGTRSEEATDRSLVIVSREDRERTIYWTQGARLKKGDPLDIAAIFDHDLVFLDVDDMPLRRFLVDLPAHTNPSARLLGALTYLADSGQPDAWEIALGHDVLVGNERELLALTEKSTLDDALTHAQSCMPGANLRACVVSRGAAGAVAVTKPNRWDTPAFSVDVVDTTGAGDAFAGAIAYATALRWDWPKAIQFANAVAALSIRRLGSQTALPTIDEIASIMKVEPATLRL
jgi:sugar/nucleoside kinase (ribokinase family)